jgi:hypothetical protein
LNFPEIPVYAVRQEGKPGEETRDETGVKKQREETGPLIC